MIVIWVIMLKSSAEKCDLFDLYDLYDLYDYHLPVNNFKIKGYINSLIRIFAIQI